MSAASDVQRLAEENNRTLQGLLARLETLNASLKTAPTRIQPDTSQEARLASSEYEQVIEEIYKQQSELIMRKQREHQAREEELKRLLGAERALSLQLSRQLTGLQASHRSLLAVLKLNMAQGDEENYERKMKELARTDPTLRAILNQQQAEA